MQNLKSFNFLHILYKPNKDKFYIGLTFNIEERLIRLNQKSKSFTEIQMIGKYFIQKCMALNQKLWSEKT